MSQGVLVEGDNYINDWNYQDFFLSDWQKVTGAKNSIILY